jgi:hypothetical protein
MYVFYIIALLPIIVGLGFYIFSIKFSIIDWLITAGASFLLAGIFHIMSYYGLTTDYETWSGQIIQAKHSAAWLEYYEYAVYRTEHYTETEYYTETDSKGRSHSKSREVDKTRQVFDHWEPTTENHDDSYSWVTSFNTTFGIDRNTYFYIAKQFNNNHSVPGDRTVFSHHNSRMIGGDPNDYIADNTTGWIQPVTQIVSFENRIKASNTVYNFVKPTEEEQKFLFQYPANNDMYHSNRVMGEARKTISDLAWDQMNSRLGPVKKVNVIIIGFNSANSMLGQEQEALFLRGKKNDIVLCYGDGWTKVFGWTEHTEVLYRLSDILVSNKIDENIIPLIETEIKADYVIKPWKQFKYISINPPPMYYLYYFITLIFVEGGLFYWALINDFDKEDYDRALSEQSLEFVERFITKLS